jgi:citrate lyase subunit beta/citryl-CoA lyase
MLRSLLFVPAIRPRFIEKAPDSGADAVILDLEDSVPPGEKAAARAAAPEAVQQMTARGASVWVRVNGLDTGLLEEDLYGVVAPGIAGICLPKANDAEIVQQVDAYLTLLEKVRGIEAGSLRLAVWVETAKAVMNVQRVLAASPRLLAANFGAEDYTADLGIVRSDDLREVDLARTQVAIAAHAAGILALDTPSAEFRDLDRVRREASYARSIGYRGKHCIHPDQVAVCNQVFGLSDAETAWAQRVIEVYEDAERKGLGAVALDGAMVDRPVYLRALRLLGR